MTYPTTSSSSRVRKASKRSRQPDPVVCCGVCSPSDPDGYYYAKNKLRQIQQQQDCSPRTSRPAAAPITPMQLQQLPQHHQQQQHHLPKTLSAGTASTAYSAASSAASSMIDNLCPVTRVYANIADDYHVFPNVIGKGHYGIVRECVHRASRQTLAVKSIDKSKIGRLDHLQREIYLLAHINHRGIMKMVDCYEDADCVHIITEKYTGGELFDKIVQNTSPHGCLTEQKAASVIKSLLEAVAYLHENGVVHRDIKPENILFESSEEDAAIRLIDFGLSRRHEKGEGPMSNPVGTAYYMAPELLKGKYDKACDNWSVGTIAYILLAGYPPFNGATDPEIFEDIKEGRFHFPDSAWKSKSDECKDFIKCLLRKDPRKRFTAKEALQHPWIVNLGRRRQRRTAPVTKKVQPKIKYLRIP